MLLKDETHLYNGMPLLSRGAEHKYSLPAVRDSEQLSKEKTAVVVFWKDATIAEYI